MTNNPNALKPVEGMGPGVYEFVHQPTRFDLWKTRIHIKLNLLLQGEFKLLRMMHIADQFEAGKITKAQARGKIVGL